MPKCLLFAGEILSGGFNFVQISFRIPGGMIYFDEHILSDGWFNRQLE